MILVSLMAFAGMASAGELETIVEKHHEAMGGLDAMKATKTVTMKGKLVINTPQGEMVMGADMWFKDRTKMRTETEMQGMKMIQVIDGETGWQINPMMGAVEPTDMTEAEMSNFKSQVDFLGDFYEAEKKGIKLEYQGTEDVEGTEAHKILVTPKDGEPRTHFLDTEYFMLLLTQSKTNQMGMEMSVNVYYSDYKKVGKLMIPHALTIKNEQFEVNFTFEEVKVNSDLSDDLFTKPEAKSGQ